MSNRLDEIIAWKKKEVERLKPHVNKLRAAALQRNDFRPFRQGLMRGDEVALIAEIKKASPSAGVIAGIFDPISIAREYERGGAHAISCLTDEKYFQGKLSYIQDIRSEVRLPVLRKDFIVDEMQIYESVVAGADAILLIVAALTDARLERLYEMAQGCQLDVIVEVHNTEEMDRALDIGADMIGINNRNLKTFEVDLKTTEYLSEEIPSDCVAISESGITSYEDVQFLRKNGVNAMLVGEALMRAPRISDKIAELLGQ